MFQNILSDIRKGDNLDYYFMFFATLALFLLQVFNAVPQNANDSILLGILSLICFALLRLRHGLSEIRKENRGKADGILLTNYPAGYRERMHSAKTIWIMGSNLRRIFPDCAVNIHNILRNGGTVYALLLKPGSEASRYAAKQDFHPLSANQYIDIIKMSLTRLADLQKLYPNNVIIKVIDQPLAFGIDAIDKDTSRGVLYVRHFPFRSPRGDQPIMEITPDCPWYEFYVQQLESHWNVAEEWVPVTKDLTAAG
jgi:hypothetical protein